MFGKSHISSTDILKQLDFFLLIVNKTDMKAILCTKVLEKDCNRRYAEWLKVYLPNHLVLLLLPCSFIASCTVVSSPSPSLSLLIIHDVMSFFADGSALRIRCRFNTGRKTRFHEQQSMVQSWLHNRQHCRCCIGETFFLTFLTWNCSFADSLFQIITLSFHLCLSVDLLTASCDNLTPLLPPRNRKKNKN